MASYIVTVRLSRLKEHDPHNKVTGGCRIGSGDKCTDSTGEHHSLLYVSSKDETIQSISQQYKVLGFHVTRVEEV